MRKSQFKGTAGIVSQLTDTAYENIQAVLLMSDDIAELASVDLAFILANIGNVSGDSAQVAADRIQVAADLVQTDADQQATAADRVQTALDVIATAADVIQTGLDRVATGNDATATAADRSTVSTDKGIVAADKALVAADLVATNQDTIDTAADLQATNQDTIDTAADAVSTGNDVVYAEEWANKAVDTLVSAAAGGDAVDDYSAMHHATKAGESAAAAIVNDHTMTEAEFFASMELNRAKFAGSGFVEWGKHHDSASSTLAPINEGLRVSTTIPDFLAMGRGASSTAGNSRTEYPLVSVNGALLKLYGVNSTDPAYNPIKINFPPAPDGTDLVTNGDFATDTDWSKGTGWTIGSGTASSDGTQTSVSNLTNTSTLVEGQTYLIEFTVSGVTAGGVTPSVGGVAGNIVTANGTYRQEIVAGASNNNITIQANSTFVGSVDNVSTIDKADLSRQDLAFLEAWHEKITTLDWVVPYGCSQSGLTTFDGVTLTNSVGNPAAGYSAFGAWEASPTVGYGAVWSTLSAADKATFLADPLNNIYLNAAGELIQVRYRIRTIAGLGNDWEKLDPLANPGNDFRYSTGGRVYSQGLLDTPVDLSTSAQYVGQDHADAPVGMGVGSWGLRTNTTGRAVDGLCFALPIALVQRRNSGAYHPVFNGNGCSGFGLTTDKWTGRTWYDAGVDRPPTTTSMCFRMIDDGGSKTHTTTYGQIGGTSRKPDGLFYDAIYAEDVKDLRLSAHKVQDYQRTLEREFNKLVDGSFRGWEGEYSGRTPIADVGYNATAGRGTWIRMPGANFSKTILTILTTSLSDIFDGINIIVNISGVPTSYAITKVHLSTSGGEVAPAFYFSDGVDVSSSIDITAGAVVPFGLGDRSIANHSAETNLHCDIIGDPANYPQSWKDHGVFGTPLLVHEDGTNLIPDGTGKSFKMSRKVIDVKLSLYSDDSGATWVSFTSWDVDLEGSSNAETNPPPVGRIIMIFYTTKANPTELAVNAEVLARGDAWAGSRYHVTWGVDLMLALIGKVPTGASANGPRKPLTAYQLDTTKKLDIGSGREPHHDTITEMANPSGPAVKILSLLSRENGRAYLNLLYKEMVWDMSLDNGLEFTDRLESATDATAVGTYYHVTNGIFQGYWQAVTSTTTALTNVTFSHRDNHIIGQDNVVYFTEWDGNGWGDNNTFTVLDNEDTELDDNGQTILIGTKRVELPFLIRGDE